MSPPSPPAALVVEHPAAEAPEWTHTAGAGLGERTRRHGKKAGLAMGAAQQEHRAPLEPLMG